MSIVRAEDLGPDVVNTQALQDRTNCSSRDNARSLGGRLEQDSSSTVLTDHLVRQGALDQRHADKIVLCCLDRFMKKSDSLAFPVPNDVAGLVADNDQGANDMFLHL